MSPFEPPKACLKCNVLVMPGSSKSPWYHDTCNPRAEDRKQADQQRRQQQEYRKLYDSSAWRTRLRPYILRRDPVCKICNRAPSTVADHINDHKGNPVLFYAETNLQGLCKPCHDIKTGEQSGYGAPMQKKEATPPKSIWVNGVEYPLGGNVAPDATNSAAPPRTPPPPGLFAAAAPSLIPVKPEHISVPEGRVAMKAEFNRWYVKRGERWFILPQTFDPNKDADENGIIKQAA